MKKIMKIRWWRDDKLKKKINKMLEISLKFVLRPQKVLEQLEAA